ncbi:MAG TPA: hypothetical protein PK926_12425 [Spirochaetota bacterium]|nr:hypothetical protein [Spirochaetota bacterium]HPI88920.1 hypothetical protein [Spirochaetota bacterium]HPR46603.1 hypothetical protein [Spirochaetota bacterium]
MKGDEQVFNMIMAKYRLSEPLTADEQAFVIKSRRKVLKSLLKKYGKYTPLFWFLILLAMMFRNAGVKLTFIQAKALLAAALVTGTAGTSAVTYAGAKYIYEHARARDVREIMEIAPIQAPAPLKGIPAPRMREQAPAPAETPAPGQKVRGRVTVPSI